MFCIKCSYYCLSTYWPQTHRISYPWQKQERYHIRTHIHLQLKMLKSVFFQKSIIVSLKSIFYRLSWRHYCSSTNARVRLLHWRCLYLYRLREQRFLLRCEADLRVENGRLSDRIGLLLYRPWASLAVFSITRIRTAIHRSHAPIIKRLTLLDIPMQICPHCLFHHCLTHLT